MLEKRSRTFRVVETNGYLRGFSIGGYTRITLMLHQLQPVRRLIIAGLEEFQREEPWPQPAFCMN